MFQILLFVFENGGNCNYINWIKEQLQLIIRWKHNQITENEP
jgi:hypothetical protein